MESKTSLKIPKGSSEGQKKKGQTKNDKRTNNDLQNTTHQRFNNRNPTKNSEWSELKYSGRVAIPAPLVDP